MIYELDDLISYSDIVAEFAEKYPSLGLTERNIRSWDHRNTGGFRDKCRAPLVNAPRGVAMFMRPKVAEFLEDRNQAKQGGSYIQD